MPRSRLNLVRFVALLWCLIAAVGITWAQTTSSFSNSRSNSSNLTPRTTLLAQVSDTESLPLAPMPPANPKRPTLPTTPAARTPSNTQTAQASDQTDPLKELARRLTARANADESPKTSATSQNKLLPNDAPPQDDKATQAESRSRELLLANPSERQPLGTPGKGLVPDTTDPQNEDSPLGGFSNNGSWVLNTLTALGVVIGLIIALRMGMNKLQGRSVIGGRGGVVEVLSRTSISPRNQVMLLRLGQRILVVSEGSNGVRTLANLDDPDEVTDLLTTINASRPGSFTQSFNQLLNRAGTEMDDPEGFIQEQGGDNDEHMIDKARNELSALLSRVRTMSKGGNDA